MWSMTQPLPYKENSNWIWSHYLPGNTDNAQFTAPYHYDMVVSKSGGLAFYEESGQLDACTFIGLNGKNTPSD